MFRRLATGVVAACLGLLIPALAGTAAAQTGYSPVPQSSNDRYVPQHFDRMGAYTPPHYEPRAKKKKPKTHFYETTPKKPK